MKLNNKGYMLVEIILASVIAMSIGYYLLNLTFKFKNKNEDVYSSTELITDKIIITKNIMNDLEGKEVKIDNVSEIDENGNQSATIKVIEEDNEKIKQILVSGKTITYGTWNGTSYEKDNSYYTKKLPNNIEIGKIIYDKKENPEEEDKAMLTIPLSDIYSKNKYDIKIFASSPIIKVNVTYELNGGTNKLSTNLLGKYDGRLNNGNSHISSGTKWANLAGGIDGTIHNTSWTSNNYLSFNGTSSWVNLGKMSTYYQTLIITFMVPELFSDDYQHYLIGNADNAGGTIYIINNEIGGAFHIKNAYHDLSSGIKIEKNVEYTVAITYNGKKINLYVFTKNSLVKSISKDISGAITLSDTVMALGCNPAKDWDKCDRDFYFKGNIYNATIYDKGLTEKEIKAEYKLKSQVIYNRKYGELPTPEKKGYSFDGWYTDSDFNNRITDIVNTRVDHPLYAKWIVNSIQESLNNQESNFVNGQSNRVSAPEEGWYKVEAWGASGGQPSDKEPAGKGGYTSGYIKLDDVNSLYVNIGTQGGISNTAAAGGYNGGGASGANGGAYSGGGGGATDIRLVNGPWNNKTSLGNRIMVAAGGGGAGNFSTSNHQSKYAIYGGDGGGLVGDNGTSTNTYYQGSGFTTTGAKQSSGGTNAHRGTSATGSFGLANQTSPDTGYGGGGGSGWYAGAQGFGTGGSGGSSYIAGYAGVNGIVINSNNTTHTNNTKSSTTGTSGSYTPYFINGKMIPGVNTGDGRVKITYYGKSKPPRLNKKLKRVRYVKDCTTGNSLGGDSRSWEEIQVIEDGLNIAKGKNVSYDGKLASGNYNLKSVVDGEILNLGNDIYDNTSKGETCVTVDLGKEYNDTIDEIAVWHIWNDGRTYYNNKTLVSIDKINWQTIINTNEPETSLGKRVSAYEPDSLE